MSRAPGRTEGDDQETWSVLTSDGFLSLDGEEPATFLSWLAARVAARRYERKHGPCLVEVVPALPLPVAWWQNDGPTWWTRPPASEAS